jgi:hypothetical protein
MLNKYLTYCVAATSVRIPRQFVIDREYTMLMQIYVDCMAAFRLDWIHATLAKLICRKLHEDLSGRLSSNLGDHPAFGPDFVANFPVVDQKANRISCQRSGPCSWLLFFDHYHLDLHSVRSDPKVQDGQAGKIGCACGWRCS